MFRYRLTKLDDASINMLSQQPDDIGKEPVEDQTVGENTADQPDAAAAPSDGSTCATGTRDLGINTGYVGGSPQQIRLCAIPGFKSTSAESQAGSGYTVAGANGEVIVSAAASGQFLGLYNAMKAAGLNPSANSSFRTMPHQQALCSANALCSSGTYKKVAKPGTSNHQGGNAIDFTNCDTRSTACYKWLNANAATFGIKNYPVEAWHWSTTGT
jgi:hypothetical protein